MKRILVVHGGGIGDFLLTFPAMALLRERGVLEVAGQPERMALAVAWGLAQRAHTVDALDFGSVFTTPSQRLAEGVSGFTGALVWMRDDDGRIVETLHALGIAEAHCFPGLPPAGWDAHASGYYLACVREITGIETPAAVPAPNFAPSPEPLDVVVHPGSGGQRKNWPLEQFMALAARLEARGRKVHWLRGPAEEGLSLPPHAAVLNAGSLVALAARLQNAALYIGNDSGISHLAGSVGCPAVAVFGPTDPNVWQPLGPRVCVVRTSATAWPEVGEVLGACETLLRPG